MTKQIASADTGALTLVPFIGPDSQWDDFVAGSPDATFCHLAAWRVIMGDVLGHECLFQVARDDRGAWAGVLPLIRVKSAVFGHYLVSMPFLNYGGPVGTSAAKSALRAWAVEEARASRANMVELRSRACQDPDLAPSPPKVTVLLSLPPGVDDLWQGLAPKVRSQIRRPQKEGMEVAFGAGQLDAFYEVFARNMRDLGTPVLPKRFFERVVSVLGDRTVIGTVHHRGRPVAAGFGFVWRDEFEMTWASSLREFNPLAPNMLLYWGFLQRTIETGLRVFNFGRCTPGAGTHRFKRQWGGVDEPLPWGAWMGDQPRSRPSPDDSRYGIAVAAWRRLPLTVSKIIGPRIARFLP